MGTIGGVPFFARDTPSPALGKAWEVIGRTLEGEAGCMPCVKYWDASDVTLSRPIFNSDETRGMTCDLCGAAISPAVRAAGH
jgi:hypothetical protein